METKRFKELIINHPYISVFGSGNSILGIPKEDIDIINQKSFTITCNYAPINLISHMNIWSDKRVSEWIIEFYKDKKKDRLWCSRDQAFNNPRKNSGHEGLFQRLDYMFDLQKDDIKGNYTLVWILQLLQKYFSDKTILIFGLDMHVKSLEEAKWYDKFTNYDLVHRGKRYPAAKKLNQCNDQFIKYIKKNNIYNCTIGSQCDVFVKKDWKEVLK